MSSSFLSVRLSNDLLEWIDQLAKKEIRSRSNMVEYLLREAMKKRQQGLDENSEK